MKNLRSNTVVTPCKNEAENLPNLIESMIMQTVRPVLWVIVDDKSIDNSQKIIADVLKKHDWIKSIRLENDDEYLSMHYADVCNMGFNFANEYCQKNGISYEYISVVDSDNLLEQEYFEKLIKEFEKNPKLGIASGCSVYLEINKTLNQLRKKDIHITAMSDEFWKLYGNSQADIQESSRSDLPMGSARMWRKSCFEETGGYLHSHSPDSVSNIKAKMKGWITKRFTHAKVIEREGSTAKGLWNGYKTRGESDFYLWYPLYYSVAKALAYSIRRHNYLGIAYLYGYIIPYILRKKRIADKEIQQYYQSNRPLEQIVYYKGKIKNLLK